MLRRVRQIVGNFVWLLLVMMVFSGSIRAFRWKQLPAASGINTDESSEGKKAEKKENQWVENCWGAS